MELPGPPSQPPFLSCSACGDREASLTSPCQLCTAMGLRESPYASRFLGGLDAVARELLYPSYWLLSQLLALQQTTAEAQEQRSQRWSPPHALGVLAKGPLLLLLLLLYLPVSLLGFLLWLPLQLARRPFAYRHTPSQASPEQWALPGHGRAFRFVSANICLLPDGLAKFSNLSRTQWRAVHIGQALLQAASHTTPPHTGSARGGACNASRGRKYGATESSPPRACRSSPATDSNMAAEGPLLEGKAALPWEITASFPPNVDFLCLQEVFDQDAASHLLRLLGPRFEHIVYDVGTYGLLLPGCSALKLLNSGLFLASRYPVLAVQYHCYPNGTGEDAFSAKGLLCAQVRGGSGEQGPFWGAAAASFWQSQGGLLQWAGRLQGLRPGLSCHLFPAARSSPTLPPAMLLGLLLSTGRTPRLLFCSVHAWGSATTAQNTQGLLMLLFGPAGRGLLGLVAWLAGWLAGGWSSSEPLLAWHRACGGPHGWHMAVGPVRVKPLGLAVPGFLQLLLEMGVGILLQSSFLEWAGLAGASGILRCWPA